MPFSNTYQGARLATQSTDVTLFAETADSGTVGAGTYKTITLTVDNLRKVGEIQFFVVYFHARAIGNVTVKLNGVTQQIVNIPATATTFPSFRNAVFIPYIDRSINHVITILNDGNQIFESIQVDARATVVV